MDNVILKSDNNITTKQNNISKAPDSIIRNRSRILEKAKAKRAEISEPNRAGNVISNVKGNVKYKIEQTPVEKHQNRVTSKGDHPVDKVGAKPRN